MDDTITVEVPAEIVEEAVAEAAPVEIPVDPNALIHADVEIARQQEETERARIDARMAVKIAEINAENDAWRNAIQASLASLETRVAAMENHQSSTPAITIVTEPEAPTIVETAPEPEPEPESDDPMPVSPEAVAPAPEAPAARPRRRWI